MNRQQRRIAQSQNKHKPAIIFRGKSYSIDEATLLAVHEHNQNNAQTAVNIYQLIIDKYPGNAATYNNRGVTLQSMQRSEEALASFEKAISLKPDYAEAHNNRCLILMDLKRFDEALKSFDKAIALSPDYAANYNSRGIVFQTLKRYDEALASYDKAISLNTSHAEAYSNRGVILSELKLYDEALASCNKAITLKSDYAEAYQNCGVIYVTKGNMQRAETMFMKASALRPDFINPLFSLINIRQYQDSNHPDIQKLQALVNASDALHDNEYAYFSLGKMYDDCGSYDEAFECFKRANQLCNAIVDYNAEKVAGISNGIIEVFNRDFLSQPLSFASDNESPVFIVGMPRSGTTLMASILSNHGSIATAGELPTIPQMTQRLAMELKDKNISYPQAVQHMTSDIASSLIHEYQTRLRRDINPSIPYVIDKHPFNFRYLGFIAMLFPKARIIHCTRDPLDTGISNYFQRFALDYDYSFDLGNIGHFYGEYARIMKHWRDVLPLRMIDVSYEDMILNTEALARKTIDFMRLEWDERCLAPHTNTYAVETASKWQVRQPIYSQSVNRWRHYDKHLGSLKESLRIAGIEIAEPQV